jgi:hypothetical protein
MISFLFAFPPKLLIHFSSPHCCCMALAIFLRLQVIALIILAPRPTPKLKGHALSAVRYCIFNLFAATSHTWRPFPLSAT